MTTGRVQAFVVGAALGGCLVAVVSQRRLRRQIVQPKRVLAHKSEEAPYPSQVDEDTWSVASSSSDSSNYSPRGDHGDKTDQSIINDLFGLSPAPVAGRRTQRQASSASEAQSSAFACSELMASSDEDLADGGHDRYYGISDSDEDTGNSWCDNGSGLPCAVCREEFVATRPCEVSVKVNDRVLIIHRDVRTTKKGSEISIDRTCIKPAREYWTVLKPPSMHHGIVPADVLLEEPSGTAAGARSSSNSALRRADFFASCKLAFLCGQQCSHEKTRNKVLHDIHGSAVQPLQLPFRVAVADPTRGRGLFAVRTIREGSTLEQCPFILDTMNTVTGRLEDYVFQLEVMGNGDEEDMYAFLQGYGSLYNHSNYPNVSYVLPHQPVDPQKLESHVVEFVARRDIVAGEELTIDYGRSYWRRRQRVKPEMLL